LSPRVSHRRPSPCSGHAAEAWHLPLAQRATLASRHRRSLACGG